MQKPQVHQNWQFLYHEDLFGLPQNLSQNVSRPELSLGTPRDGINVETGISAARTVYQSDAPSDLKVVSWAPDVPFRRSKSYAYDPASGAESIVYVIENGIEGANRVNKSVNLHARALC